MDPRGMKNGEPIISDQFSVSVTPGGFEPPTPRAEIWYSIQLNYGAIIALKDRA